MIFDRMEKTYQPLVSVAVITYNSSKTVVETLDSIANQTYPNLELIVSDDCSPDNTVEMCRDWIEAHKERFVRTELLTVEKNTGVSGNMNRAVRVCLGEWIKPIAGDDKLLYYCIETYIGYAMKHIDAMCVFSKVEPYGASKEHLRRVESLFDYSFFELSEKEQYRYLVLQTNCIPAATVFFNKTKFQDLKLQFDERIPLLEDWPMWINLLKAGGHFDFINIITVRYRISETALSTGNHSRAFLKSNAIFYKIYRFREVYKNVSKKRAIECWLRAQFAIHQNVFWHVIFKLYKICVIGKK